MAHISRYERLGAAGSRSVGLGPLRRWTVGALLLFCLGLAATFLGAQAVGRQDAHSSRENFKLAANEVVANFNLELAHETDLLFDEGAFMRQNPSLSPPEFWQFAQDARVKSRFPELVGIAEIRLVPRPQLARWLRRLSEHPPFQGEPRAATRVVPAGARPYYCLTLAAVAPQPANSTGVAFDTCSAAGNLLSTRASGKIASYAVEVLDGVLVYGEAMPVYRTGLATLTAAERTRAFVGWVGLALDPQLLLREAMVGNPRIRVVLSKGDGIGLRFASGPRPGNGETLVAGLANGMTAAISGPVKPAAILANRNATLVLFGGLTTFLLIAALVFTLGTGRERARLTVAEKTVELEYQALHDSLSGLPNRTLVFDRARQALARAQRIDSSAAAMFIDVDGFKNVNDSFGHAAGDQLIKAVAARLRGVVRDADTVGRFGGDEFIVLLDPPATAPLAVLVAERILALMGQPIVLDEGQEVTVSVSIGIAAGQHPSADALLRDADLALYAAKQSGRNRYAEFTEATQAPGD
jgi:diguanylate cyclase (GGDEF)-like protein